MIRLDRVVNIRKQCKSVLTVCALLLLLFYFGLMPLFAESDIKSDTNDTEAVQSLTQSTETTNVSALPAADYEMSDEYGDVSEEEINETEVDVEEKHIADPLEPINRAMFHFNDKLYFWVWKPAAEVYKYVVPEEVRGLFSSFYYNIKAPVRIVNNLLQGKPGYAGIELLRFLINSTIGVVGLRDCAKECFDIKGRDADFGQTLGRYGIGHGFYVVAPFIGPTSPRDGFGWFVDWTLRPTTYVGDSDAWFTPQGVGLYLHETINNTSFRIGDYEMFKEAAIDPYIAMRDVYVQYRRKMIER